MIYRVNKERINEEDCQQLYQELTRILNTGEDIILDLSKAKYICPSGLRTIVMSIKVFRAKGFDFSIVNANSDLVEIIKATRLDDMLLISEEDKKNMSR